MKLPINKKITILLFMLLTLLIGSLTTSAIKIENEKEIQGQTVKVLSQRLGKITVTPDAPYVTIDRIDDKTLKYIDGVKVNYYVEYDIETEGMGPYARATLRVFKKSDFLDPGEQIFFKEIDTDKNNDPKTGKWTFNKWMSDSCLLDFELYGEDKDFYGATATTEKEIVRIDIKYDFAGAIGQLIGDPESPYYWHIFDHMVVTGGSFKDTGEEYNPPFRIKNEGKSGSKLDWEIYDWPSWGEWNFYPKEGTDLTPADGWKDVNIAVTVPSVNEQRTFAGEIIVRNKKDYDQKYTVNVEVEVKPKGKSIIRYSPNKITSLKLENFIQIFNNIADFKFNQIFLRR